MRMRILAFLTLFLSPILAYAQPSAPPASTLYRQSGVPGTPQWTANQEFNSIDSVLYCGQFASIQACHAALPSTGGKMILPPNTTISQTSLLTISKPNVTIECPSWSTVIQRGPSLSGGLVLLNGVGDTIQNCTIDGNGSVNTSGVYDLALNASNQLAMHVQIINGGGIIQTQLSGVNDRIAYSTIIGLGISNQTYGIWAIGHVKVTIDHNTVSSTGIDAIGFDGTLSAVTDNHVFNHHCYTGIGGGGIVQYPGYSGELIANNTIDKGCGTASLGLELNGPNLTVVGNVINQQQSWGIAINGGSQPGILLAANTIRESGQSAGGGGLPGVLIGVNSSGVTISGGNRINDEQASITTTCIGTVGVAATSCTMGSTAYMSVGDRILIAGAGVASANLPASITIILGSVVTWDTPTSTSTSSPTVTGIAKQSYAVQISAGASDNIVIEGNDLSSNLTGAILDAGTGTNKVIKNNLGLDNVIPAVASASALALPLNPTISLTGTTGVTSITADAWTGREVKMIPTGVVTFTAGNNIGNSVTTSANVPLTATFNGTNWYLK